MNDSRAVVADADHELEGLAAELTSAAYAVALRHGVEYKWLDLEAELWEALKETVKKWDRNRPPSQTCLLYAIGPRSVRRRAGCS
jgi:hypothetical protein